MARRMFGLRITTREQKKMANESKYIPPIHPGEILKKEYLEPLGMSQARLAQLIGVSARVVGEIVRGRRAIDADMAMRLGRFSGMPAQFWLGLQNDYELGRIRYAELTQEASCFDFIKKFIPKGAAAL